ncbi:MAG TPA: hypothetical protein PKC29_12455 [Thermodesulfobacteriota bacterium]|nr:hypothetical protein [Thermodesulfobacteriota bacterium]
MELKSRIGNFYSGNTIILAVILILVAVLVSVFNAYYFTSTLNDQRGQELAQLFSSSNKGFSDTAKDILDTRGDILYIKLTNPDGILIESYGDGENQTAEIFPIRTPDNNTIVLGVTPHDYQSLALSAIMWSALIGIAFTVFFVFIGSFFSTGKNDSMEKLIAAMKSVTRGDLSTRLNPDSVDDVSVIRAYETFNQMLDRLRKRDDLEIEEDDVPPFQPTLITSNIIVEEEDIFPVKERNVIVIVAKIADFQDLSTSLDPAEFNSFLADYRKAASTIISGYGGVIEALLKDEIVAFFNAPEEQDNAELKAICAAVEVLQLLASITRERKIEGKTAISGKIGIAMKAVSVYDETGVPHGIKDITEAARKISNVAPVWRVIVSADVYQVVSDFVDARELKLGSDSFYSIVGVEEGVV